MNDVLGALAGSGPAVLLRTSFVLYPVVNALHIFAVGALVTSVLLMDLRLLGLGKGIGAEAVIMHLRPVAVAALGLAVLTGLALFSVRPFDYAGNPAFRIKLVLLMLAGLNAVLFTLRRTHERPGLAMRLGVLLSAALWPAVLLAGRFIGFLQ